MAAYPQEANNAIYPSDHGFDSSKTDSKDKIDHEKATGPDLRSGKVADNGFGGGEGSKNFRTMTKWDTVFALLTNQVGLGVLSLPGVLKVFGIIPGIIAIIGIGCLSWYTAFELKQFYSRHQHVLNVVDMAKVVGGPTFEVVAGIGLLIQVIMTAASASVTLSIAFNTISGHSLCTVGYIGIGCLGCWVLCAPRTAKFVSQSGLPCCISVIAAALIVMISLGVSNPTDAPPNWDKEILIVGKPSFREGLNACLKICYAYSGNINFVSYMAEMIDPVNDFNFALACLEVSSISFYTIVAIAIYCLAGEYTVSPALGSAPHVTAQIAYGIVLPAVFSTGLAFGHTGIKYVYVEVMKRSKLTHEMTANTVRSWSIWMTIVTVFWVLCFLLSNAIPVFDSILSIASATTISWFTFGLSAIFWLHINWDVKFNGWKKTTLACINFFLIFISLFINGAGLWSSVTELIDLMNSDDSSVQGVFDCGDNALF
ncbi:transmembrane amino acid transporter protein-domain-containing protein [Ilyonectria robusta]|uniref:transmembrane amino acid transporter protein-domain-containing protein n=1 Tax=Ilyonectria robusta TaxID=1079257 RepID=UPI001E8DA05D|nr:transmembrane amino acid transporter protein-domain-containing protein [Ilyonectria robusta]KAH8706355.1 transmembrane amino acid transporter protein-domain-containing protein [Ilyonectria robusta]